MNTHDIETGDEKKPSSLRCYKVSARRTWLEVESVYFSPKVGIYTMHDSRVFAQ